MAGFSHLTRRSSGVYVVRLVVPQALRAAFGKGEIHKTTGCRDLAMAKIVAAQVAAEWHGALQRLRRMDPQKIRAGSVEFLGDGLIHLVQAADALGTTPGGLAERLAAASCDFFVSAADVTGWVVEDVSRLEIERDALGRISSITTNTATLDKCGQREKLHSVQLKVWFVDEALAAARANEAVPITFFRVVGAGAVFVVDGPGLAVAQGQLQVRRKDVEALRVSIAAELSPVLAVTEPVSAVDSIAKAAYQHKPISELVAAYRTHALAHVGQDELRRQADAGALLIELSADKKIGLVDRMTLREFAVQVGRVPDRRDLVKRKFKLKAPSWHELICVADKGELPRLTTQAVERIIEDVNSVFVWGHRNGWLRENPCQGLAGDIFKGLGGIRTAQREKRDQFSDEDLQNIFGQDWFANGHGSRTKSGVFHRFRPYHFWLPLLGLFAGGRINELAQLHLADIRRTEGGNWYIDFNLDQPDKINLDDPISVSKLAQLTDRVEVITTAIDRKSLKTANAIRAVPLHSQLIYFGLIKYVEKLREAGHIRLFPELSYDKQKGYGKQASAWFNERFLGRDLGMARDGKKVFHSFRHNFATALERKEVPTLAAQQLLGHAPVAAAGETAPGYKKAREINELAPYVEKLRYQLPTIAVFDGESGLAALADALKLKEAQRN